MQLLCFSRLFLFLLLPMRPVSRLATCCRCLHTAGWPKRLQPTSQTPCMLQRKRDTGAEKRTSCLRVGRAAHARVWLKRGSSTMGLCRARSWQSL